MPESFNRFSTVFSSGGICMRASRVVKEVMGGTEELQVECRLMSGDRLRFGLRLQSLFQNALQAVDVEQVEVESPPAGRVQTSGAVAFGQAQQLLRLPQTAPGELTAEKLIGESAGGGSEFACPLAVVVGPAQGVGSPAFRVIGVVGGAAAGRLALMRLDQLAARIDTNQRSIAADLDLAADPARGKRVERLAKADMMIRMNFALSPGRRLEAFGLEGNQLGLLFRLEHLQGHSPGGSVDAAASDLAAPDQSAARHVLEIDKRLPLEEALADVGHTIFHQRFVLGVARPGRIGQKAAVVGVLQKGPVEARGVGIGLSDTRFHSVDDDTPGTALKKCQGAFEAIDNRVQILLENGDHAAEPAVAQRQDEALNHPWSPASEFLQQAEPAEVGFGHFAG